ncbi:Fic family protein [Desulfatitalea tepidiphila]|uniref:Fic family protein n=1 Tax=Desulfatitalea tepidiphila TaxID=1185843 RepID=UPI0006B45DBD|nr:Fic family protein [Desulfatitalea tepidiphila]
MVFDRDKPFNDLPLLPPDVDLESKAILKKAIAANRELAELKGAGDAIPNQAILVNSIVLQEARLSSEIENIVTTSDELYKAADEDPSKVDQPTKEVLHYREALWHGFENLKTRPLSTNLFIELVGIIKQIDLGIRKVPGTKIADSRGQIVYTPPEGEALLRELLANLERFMNAEDGIDPLVKLAVFHYQFEAIHPFTDGNGRTGRIINILYLVEQELLKIPVLYLSHYIIRNKADYYAGLRRVTEQNAWEEWILYMLEAIAATARQTRDKIFRIRDLVNAAQETARTKAPKIYSKDLIELIFEQPYCKIRFLEQRALAKRQTASVYLKTLEEIGLLQSLKVGREVYFMNMPLLAILKE